MYGVTLTNKIHQLLCIQYEVKVGRSVFKAYKSFCKAFGEEAMTYRDFDFWFYRFTNSLMDLQHDRSQDPQNRELSDMPMDIMEHIIGRLRWKERSVFRKVSKSIREAVDCQPLIFDEIDFCGRRNMAFVSIDEQSIKYRGISDNDVNLTLRCKDRSSTVVGHRSGALAFEELFVVLQNPKIRIKRLSVQFDFYELAGRMRSLLMTLNHKIHVEQFELQSNFGTVWDDEIQKEAMTILPYLKPRVLHTFSVRGKPRGYSEPAPEMLIDQLSQLEQWKQAKRFATNCAIPMRIDALAHFQELDVHLSAIRINDVIRLRDIYLVTPSFESCRLQGSLSRRQVMEAVGAEKFPMTHGNLEIDVISKNVSFKKIC